MEHIEYGGRARDTRNTYHYAPSGGRSIMKGAKQDDTRKMKSSKKRAADNLANELKLFPGQFSESSFRDNIYKKYSDIDQISYMNTKILAMVLALRVYWRIENTNNTKTINNLTKKNFNNVTIKQFMTKIKPNLSVNEIPERLVIEYKLTIIRYLKGIDKYLEQKREIYQNL